MNLAVIGRVHIIEKLYGKVLIPEAVFHELSAIIPDTSVQTCPWIERQGLKNKLLAESLRLELDTGEAEAIALAVETKAGLLLMDERRGRKAALRFGLKYIGLIGMLVEGKRKGIITSVKPVLDDLVAKAGFWIGNNLYARILQESGE
jgi:predicted nucleic acid-binding protein